MKTNVTFNQIAENLTKVFNNPAAEKQYNATGETYTCLCGWCGTMSPESRPAYAKTFGLDTVIKAEVAARKAIADNEKLYNSSNYRAHMDEAKKAEEAGNKAPAAGAFVFGVHTGLKCDDGCGVFGELEAAINYPDALHDDPDLCKVAKVYTVTAEEFARPSLADELVKKAHENHVKFPGGACNDDQDKDDLFDEYRYYYTEAAAVVCETSGRWFLINSEGFDYARYILMPTNWADMFAAEKAAEEEKKARREEEERKEAEREAAEELAAYKARCEKWEHLMTDLTPLLKAKQDAEKLHGWRSKEYKTAERKLNAARRANIAAMAKAAFPGLRVSIRQNTGWGSAYDLTYTDGPTEKHFKENTDFDLFEAVAYTFDGMTDCADFAYRKHTDFADKYLAASAGGVKIDRERSQEARQQLLNTITEVIPEAADNEPRTWSQGDFSAIAARLGCPVDDFQLFDYWERDRQHTAAEVAARAWYHCDFPTEKPQEPTTPTDPTDSKVTKKESDQSEETAPAEGLALVEIAGGVAVVGDARTTYRNRKEIKAHGARWNKEAQQWQATEPEAVASLRRWFGVGDPEQPTPDDDPTPTKRNEKSAIEAAETTETAETGNNTIETGTSAQSEEKPQNIGTVLNCPEWLRVGVSFCLVDFVTGQNTNIIYKCTAIDTEKKTFTVSTRIGVEEYKFSSFFWPQFAPVDPTPEESESVKTSYYKESENSPISENQETGSEFKAGGLAEFRDGIFEIKEIHDNGTAILIAYGGCRLSASVSDLKHTDETKKRLPGWLKRGTMITDGHGETAVIASVGRANVEMCDGSEWTCSTIGWVLIAAEVVEECPAVPEWLTTGAKVVTKRTGDHPAEVLDVEGQAVTVRVDYGAGCSYECSVCAADCSYYKEPTESQVSENQETETKKQNRIAYISARVDRIVGSGLSYVTRTIDNRASIEVGWDPKACQYVATYRVNGEVDEVRKSDTSDSIVEMIYNFEQGYAYELDGIRKEIVPYYKESENSPIPENPETESEIYDAAHYKSLLTAEWQIPGAARQFNFSGDNITEVYPPNDKHTSWVVVDDIFSEPKEMTLDEAAEYLAECYEESIMEKELETACA